MITLTLTLVVLTDYKSSEPLKNLVMLCNVMLCVWMEMCS